MGNICGNEDKDRDDSPGKIGQTGARGLYRSGITVTKLETIDVEVGEFSGYPQSKSALPPTTPFVRHNECPRCLGAYGMTADKWKSLGFPHKKGNDLMCDLCKGTGEIVESTLDSHPPSGVEVCKKCFIPDYEQRRGKEVRRKCSACNNTGQVTCETCGGHRYLTQQEWKSRGHAFKQLPCPVCIWTAEPTKRSTI